MSGAGRSAAIGKTASGSALSAIILLDNINFVVLSRNPLITGYLCKEDKMQILVHLAISSIGFFIIGGTLCSWVMRNPNISPIWAAPATLFCFVPAIIAGCLAYNCLIK